MDELIPKPDFNSILFSPQLYTISKGLISFSYEAIIEFFFIKEKEKEINVPNIPINNIVNLKGNIEV